MSAAYRNASKEVLFWIILTILSIVFGLACIEVSARILAPEHYLGPRMLTSVEDKTKIWAPPVNKVQYFRNPDTGERVTLLRNNLGLRMTEDVTAAFLRETKNIAFFGASFTENVRVAAEYSFPEVFKALLNAGQRRFQVLNFGVGAYGIGQSYLRYKELDADIRKELSEVIVVVHPSDLWNSNNGRIASLGEDGQLILTPQGPTLPRFVGWIRSFYFPYVLADMYNTIIRLIWGNDGSVKKKKHLENRPPQEDAVRLFNTLMLDWQNEVIAAGGKFHIVVLPLDDYWSVVQKRDARLDTMDIHEFFVSILPESEFSALRFRNDQHWNEAGNLLAALALFEGLRAELQLPGSEESQTGALLNQYYSSFASGWQPTKIGKLDFTALTAR